MSKKYLLLPDGINRFGYVPRSEQFKRAVINAYGVLRKGKNEYCYIDLGGAGAELIRYDEQAKRWAILCFTKTEQAA
jgi:hypothetical protein